MRLLRKQNTRRERVVDVQDDPAYWNVPSRVREDTGSLPEGYDPKQDPMVDTIHNWCLRYNVPHDGLVLEFGCGGGRILMLWHAARQKFRTAWGLHGLDHAPNAIQLAQSRLPHVKFFPCEIDNLVGSSVFDVIFTHTALQHNSNWKQCNIYPEFVRLLKPGGLLWLINEKTFSAGEGGKVNDPLYSDDRGSAGTAAWWISQVASYGFELLEYHKSEYTFRAF